MDATPQRAPRPLGLLATGAMAALLAVVALLPGGRPAPVEPVPAAYPASSPSAMTAARIAARAMTVTTMTLRRLDARSSHAPTNGPDAMPGRSCAAAPAPATAGLPVRSSR